MPKKRILWQLFPSYIAVIVLSVLAIALLATNSIKSFYLNKEKSRLESTALMIEALVRDELLMETHSEIDAICKNFGKRANARITVIIPSGVVIGDSDENPAHMENHADRPEIIEALAGNVGTSKRRSPTLKKDMIYVAIPVRLGDLIVGVVRTSVSVADVSKALKAFYKKIAVGGFLVGFLAILISLLAAHRINKPIEELRRGAERFAKGDLSYRLYPKGPVEINVLANAMNEMANQLAERIQTMTRQRNELEAVLSSMVEAVIAVDSDEKVIRINNAASEFLKIDAERAYSKSIYEVTRNPELQKFVKSALSSSVPVEGEIILHDASERFLQAHGTTLFDAEGKNIGALIVLNDITRLKKLENIRREFVANVSHELKTPITSIKGFVETLEEGAFEDKENAQKFLEIISKHADRLNAILEDLLTLSRIDQDDERGQIFTEESKIKDVLESAVSVLATRSKEKNISIEIECPVDLMGKVNPQLLEQAVSNLIDNAIKFSEQNGRVKVEAYSSANEIVIKVQDWGLGIASEHLPRIFERFYRADKSRSRQFGGTGLGLAITKHIVLAHKGRVSVESKLGEGSTFYIHLPA